MEAIVTMHDSLQNANDDATFYANNRYDVKVVDSSGQFRLVKLGTDVPNGPGSWFVVLATKDEASEEG